MFLVDFSTYIYRSTSILKMGAREKVKSEMVISNPWVWSTWPWFGVFSHGIGN
jgi:hypothetical protein